MEFHDDLNRVLPADLPRRAVVIQKASEHLALILETNQQFNLTRITDAHEAVVKHVLDSVIPWTLFQGVTGVLDAGAGAGFPGFPLALVFPDIQFTLAESTQKKARFLEMARERLELENVHVKARRAEEIWRDAGAGIITARALAPVERILRFFAPALKTGSRILLYKGPDAEQEIAQSAKEARRLSARISVIMRYDLPDSMGARAIVEIRAG